MSKRRFKLCLAGSGGGHVRQLLDLEPAWRDHDHFFVTENLALGRSVGGGHRAYFVPHYAFGQLRIGQKRRMIAAAVANFWRSLRIVLKERPDVVLTTGAGAVFFTTVLARLFGARLLLIESYARFDAPSVFGRLTKRLATCTIVCSEPLKARWPDAKLFDPLRVLDEKAPPKQSLLFATVGATLPFPRLIEAVLALKAAGRIPEHVVAQVGEGVSIVPPPDVEIVETLPFDRIQALLKDADLAICHGGTGSLITALRAGCRTIAMPRRFALEEHYDDHQEEITEAFKARGLIEVALDQEELAACLDRARAKAPVIATTEPDALIDYLRTLLSAWKRAG